MFKIMVCGYQCGIYLRMYCSVQVGGSVCSALNRLWVPEFFYTRKAERLDETVLPGNGL